MSEQNGTTKLLCGHVLKPGKNPINGVCHPCMAGYYFCVRRGFTTMAQLEAEGKIKWNSGRGVPCNVQSEQFATDYQECGGSLKKLRAMGYRITKAKPKPVPAAEVSRQGTRE